MTPAVAASILRFGECELDLDRAELRRNGRVMPTTALELKLLEIFLGRAGRVLTRRVLIDEAWGPDTAITERVVDNQIAHLRRKIEPSPASPRFLKSVRGIGYRFDLEDAAER
jgi:DNA-binding response OmpR family regulator